MRTYRITAEILKQVLALDEGCEQMPFELAIRVHHLWAEIHNAGNSRGGPGLLLCDGLEVIKTWPKKWQNKIHTVSSPPLVVIRAKGLQDVDVVAFNNGIETMAAEVRQSGLVLSEYPQCQTKSTAARAEAVLTCRFLQLDRK